ncbi:unnamed protein product [Bemisia tabaci]|uniref:Uncharacterized protein n=1 Tax=Bemisia tabaci TaxID=7038 RepID=A0A9P0EY72_BEMTA|nr:unnamed protein product [Bemisia tabaci]
MTAVFDLPSINGAFEVGIAVGVDPSLPDNHRLPIIANSTISRAAGYTAAWAAVRFSSNPPEVRNLYCSAAAGIILAGLAETVSGRTNGDWISREQTDPTITEPAPPGSVTQEAIIKALSIVISTKANLFLMNHHTGQGPLAGYAKKVVLVQYPNWRDNDAAVVTCVHTIGHWASSISVFTAAAVPGIKALSGPTYTKTINIVLSNDAKLRFAGMPAEPFILVFVTSFRSSSATNIISWIQSSETRVKVEMWQSASFKQNIMSSSLGAEVRTDSTQCP